MAAPIPRSAVCRPLLAPLLAALLAGCGVDEGNSGAAPAPAAALPQLGLMTSLPLYWPLGAQLSELASDTAPAPWQRAALEAGHQLVLLDTLSPIAPLTPDAPESDPLAGLARLAIIQPRGLSPADNVALDDWVQAGGRLLIALDPQLTGEYDVPLGDPRRPSDVALIPPVLARWGLAIRFDDAQPLAMRRVPLGKAAIPLVLAGEVAVTSATRAHCKLVADGAAARCRVGRGQVTLLADAAVFEAAAASDEDRASLAALIAFAFD